MTKTYRQLKILVRSERIHRGELVALSRDEAGRDGSCTRSRKTTFGELLSSPTPRDRRRRPNRGRAGRVSRRPLASTVENGSVVDHDVPIAEPARPSPSTCYRREMCVVPPSLPRPGFLSLKGLIY
ncbi:hypothetical protein GWI33_013118 [Rhynchophorus ferrugineus]|uniref:Uncharacterized protein n=1 Tax=Rhynchophorus ferrugineus TaxID=354439 RepID=A0A834M849_RHYFE|nr:hypothetical protein GWI33_013118 [Rhynchophorus ferrugineus]